MKPNATDAVVVVNLVGTDGQGSYGYAVLALGDWQREERFLTPCGIAEREARAMAAWYAAAKWRDDVDPVAVWDLWQHDREEANTDGN